MNQDFLKNLNEEQKKAVTYGNGHLLIVAGAGTGKTTVITQRAAWLIEQGLAKPEEILVLTFTDKAAGELEERIDKLLPYGFVDLWVNTFHAFGERILRQHGLDIGLPGDFKLLTQTDTWLLLRENLDKFDLDYYRPLGNPTKFIHALLRHFSRAKDEMIKPEDYANYAENSILNKDNIPDEIVGLDDEIKRLKEIASSYVVYNQILLNNNSLDFGDLIFYTLELFKKRPRILDFYRKKFKYILVDEFQDTNLAQYELIKFLAEPDQNLTVVGDDDQSIYKFRGASISNILHFKNDYPRAALVTLIKNYRSCQEILDKAYILISNNNPDRLEEKLKINKKLIALEGGGLIEEIHARTGEEEAKKIAERIVELKEADDKHNWNDFSILIRSNSAADSFMFAFNRMGIPYQFLASAGLYHQEIVLDIIAYLKLLDNYHENPATFRILNMKLWGITTPDLVKINHQAKKKSWSIYETMKHAAIIGVAGENCKKIDKIISLIEKHASLARIESVGKVVLNFLQDSGYLKNLISKSNGGDGEAIRQIGFLREFFNTIVKFEQSNSEKLVKHYLAHLGYILESGEEGSLKDMIDEGPESVKIMTVHGAKGLEFKYVFIVNLVEQKFPTQNRNEAIELPEALVKEVLPEGDIHLQEERRLFYVAMTRAKKGLFFSYADFYDTNVRKRKPSRFLNEIDLALKQVEENEPEQVFTNTETKKDNDFNLSLPKHFSFTQLRAFETCPYQYRFAHILQIPTKGNASFSFGRTMHLTLQKFYDQVIRLNSATQGDLFASTKSEIRSTKPTREELLGYYDLSWVDEWYENKKQKEMFYEKGKKILNIFYEKTEQVVPKVLEVGFHIKIGDYSLRGQIDRIDPMPNESVEIIDYKTGQPKNLEDLTLDDKEQLLLYQIAATESLREKPALLSFYYLDNNQKVSFIGAPNDLQKVKDKILKNIDSIKNSDFPAKPSEHNCRHCDFKDICEYATT